MHDGVRVVRWLARCRRQRERWNERERWNQRERWTAEGGTSGSGGSGGTPSIGDSCYTSGLVCGDDYGESVILDCDYGSFTYYQVGTCGYDVCTTYSDMVACGSPETVQYASLGADCGSATGHACAVDGSAVLYCDGYSWSTYQTCSYGSCAGYSTSPPCQTSQACVACP